MTVAIGMDIGGTKVALQAFAPDWRVLHRERIATPATADALVEALAGLVARAEARCGRAAAVGIGSAGLVRASDGTLFAANLGTGDARLPWAVSRRIEAPVTWLNDARAFTLSEAVLGAGRGCRVVAGLVIGTGVGGGVAVDGRLLSAPGGPGGEIGHLSIPAALLEAENLPVLPCGCGARGCFETFLSGPGLSRLAQAVTGRSLAPEAVVAGWQDDPALSRVRTLWSAIAGDLVRLLVLIVDPDIVVLGGGLAGIEGCDAVLRDAARASLWDGFEAPRIVRAQDGAASGTRGAALAALQAIGGADDGAPASGPLKAGP